MYFKLLLTCAILLLSSCKQRPNNSKVKEQKMFMPIIENGGENGMQATAYNNYTLREVILGQIRNGSDGNLTWMPINGSENTLNLDDVGDGQQYAPDDNLHRGLASSLCKNVNESGECVWEADGQPYSKAINEANNTFNESIASISQDGHTLVDQLRYIAASIHDKENRLKLFIDAPTSDALKLLSHLNWDHADTNVYMENGVERNDAVIVSYNPGGSQDVAETRVYRKIPASPDNLLQYGVPNWEYHCLGAIGSECVGLGIDPKIINFLSSKDKFQYLNGTVTDIDSSGIMASYVSPYLLAEYKVNGTEIYEPVHWVVSSIGLGSIAHDSCCHINSGVGAAWCDGPEHEIVDWSNRGLLPAASDERECDDEWRRAVFDVFHNLNWNVIMPLFAAEMIEMAFSPKDNEGQLQANRYPSYSRIFKLPLEPWNVERVDKEIDETFITYPGFCNVVNGEIDPNCISDTGWFRNRLNNYADGGTYNEGLSPEWQALLHRRYKDEDFQSILYKIAWIAHHIPKGYRVTQSVAGSAIHVRDFCPSSSASGTGNPADSMGHILQILVGREAPDRVRATEKVEGTIYCGEQAGPSSVGGLVEGAMALNSVAIGMAAESLPRN